MAVKKQKTNETWSQLVHDHKYWYYQCIMYLDSAPSDWMDKIKAWGVDCLISPYHDHDKLENGQDKKPHYHVIILGDTSRYYYWAINMFKEINGVFADPDRDEEDKDYQFRNETFYKNNIIKSKRRAIRYLTHKDDADKHQYKDSDVTVIGGIDYYSEIAQTSDKYRALSEMQDWCEKNEVFSFRFLSNYAKREQMDWYQVLVDGGHNFMYRWLRSFEYDLREGINCTDKTLRDKYTYSRSEVLDKFINKEE